MDHSQSSILFTTFTHLQVVQPVFDFCLHARVFLKDVDIGDMDVPDEVTFEENDIAILRIWQCYVCMTR